MIRAPRQTRLYTLRRNRMVESVDTIVNWIEKGWPVLMMCAIFVIWAGVMDSDYRELTAADKRAAEDAQAQRDELAAWVSRNTVRVSIEGDRATVANMAQQFANMK